MDKKITSLKTYHTDYTEEADAPGEVMKVKIDGESRDIRSVWMEEGNINFIDQRLLPHKLEYFLANDVEEVAFAIRNMVVRGAPAIGVAAAFGMAKAKILDTDLNAAAELLKATRPTAYDLFYAVDHMINEIDAGAVTRN